MATYKVKVMAVFTVEAETKKQAENLAVNLPEINGADGVILDDVFAWSSKKVKEEGKK